MRQPVQNHSQIAKHQPGWLLWPVDHHDRQVQLACGSKFRNGACAPGIFGHQMCDPMALQQVEIACQIERSAGHFYGTVRQWQFRLRRIDQPQQVVMLWFSGKARKVLFSNGKKHPGWRLRQCRNRARNIIDVYPPVALNSLPGRAHKSTKRHIGLGAALQCVAAHLGGKGMGRIDHMTDTLSPEKRGKALGTTKASHPCGQRLRHRVLRAPRVREQRICPGLGQNHGQLRGLAGAAQKKDSRHV